MIRTVSKAIIFAPGNRPVVNVVIQLLVIHSTDRHYKFREGRGQEKTVHTVKLNNYLNKRSRITATQDPWSQVDLNDLKPTFRILDI